VNRSIVVLATSVLLMMTVHDGFAVEPVQVPADHRSRSERKSHCPRGPRTARICGRLPRAAMRRSRASSRAMLWSSTRSPSRERT